MKRLQPIGAVVVLGLIASACSSATESDAGGPTSAPATTGSFGDEPTLDARLTREFVDASLEEQMADFLVDPNSGKSALIAANMGATGEVRWTPWLLDLHRLGHSTATSEAAIAALEELSGIPAVAQRTEDFQNYGQWWQSQRQGGGEGYREWKLTLYGMIDDEFAELLSGIGDDQLLSEIHWGGVLRGGIPELNNPVRLPVSEADWMEPDELVLGAEVNGNAVAYPVRILGHHELANDVIDGIPVSMVYCTLCRTGLLFDRRFPVDAADPDGEQIVLDLETSGLLWSTNKIMVDVQTDTLWQHLTGTGIAGVNENRVLDQFPVVTTTWEDWVAEHPDSETLAIPGPIFFPDNPERPPIVYPYEAGGAYESYYANPDVWFPIFDTPDTFPLKTPVLGVSHEGEALAVEVDALGLAGATVFVVGGRPVVLVPTSGGARGYDGTELDLDALGLADGDQLPVVDNDAEQLQLEDGSILPRITVSQTFWFAWFGDNQDTGTWPG